MDVEAMFIEAIKPLGGVPVKSIVGESPPFDNADFLFARAGVIAELKCLDIDQIRQASTISKFTAAYLEEVRAGREQLDLSPHVRVTGEYASPTFLRRVRMLYQEPLHRAIKKANKQIKETKMALGMPEALGLLILANNNNTALDPKHSRELIIRLLDKETFSGINSVMYVTAGQSLDVPGWQTGHAVLDIHRRPKAPNVDLDFIAKLREGWIGELSRLLGIPGLLVQTDTATLQTLTNKSK